MEKKKRNVDPVKQTSQPFAGEWLAGSWALGALYEK